MSEEERRSLWAELRARFSEPRTQPSLFHYIVEDRREGAPNAPDWLALVNRVDWQIVGLFLLVDVLFLLGLVVANAAGLLPVGHPPLGGPSTLGGVASGVRGP